MFLFKELGDLWDYTDPGAVNSTSPNTFHGRTCKVYLF